MPIVAKTKGTFLKLFFFGALIAIGFGKKNTCVTTSFVAFQNLEIG